jgi:hypothetical protein
MVDVQPELGRETEGRIPPRADAGEERLAPNGRLAVMFGELWAGILTGEGCSKGQKVYAGFNVVDCGNGVLEITKIATYDRKSPEYREICRHLYGKGTSPTPMSVFAVSNVIEGRNCQLLTR